MDNRTFADEQADLLRGVNAMGELLASLISRVEQHIKEQQATLPVAEGLDPALAFLNLQQAQPERWLYIAQTHLQQGLMAMRRSIEQPPSF